MQRSIFRSPGSPWLFQWRGATAEKESSRNRIMDARRNHFVIDRFFSLPKWQLGHFSLRFVRSRVSPSSRRDFGVSSRVRYCGLATGCGPVAILAAHAFARSRCERSAAGTSSAWREALRRGFSFTHAKITAIRWPCPFQRQCFFSVVFNDQVLYSFCSARFSGAVSRFRGGLDAQNPDPVSARIVRLSSTASSRRNRSRRHGGDNYDRSHRPAQQDR
jgi:hypothetical protein